MRIKTVDFTQYEFSMVHIDGGFQGEHRATQLKIICSVENPDDKTFKLVFEPGGVSETLYSINGEVTYEIPQSLTNLKKVKTTLEAYEGEERIYKSPIFWLNFAPSAQASSPTNEQAESFNAEVAGLNKKVSDAIDELSNNTSNPLMQKVKRSTAEIIELSNVSPHNHFINAKVYKKNLITYPYKDGTSKTTNGIKFSVNSDGTIRATGTGLPIKDYATFYLTDNITLLDGEKYSLSERTVVSFEHNGVTKYFGAWNSPFEWHKAYKSPCVYAEIPKGDSVVVTTIKPQIEFGEFSTEYEKGLEASNIKINAYDEIKNKTEYAVNSYGSAKIKSISPKMKLEVSNKNLNIVFEYQKDINTADYEKLKNIPKINGKDLKGDLKITKETLGVKDGERGEKGETGAKGEQGIAGPKGDRGQDGVSPSITIEQIKDGSRVTFKDKSGNKSIDIFNGKDGSGVIDTPIKENQTEFFDSTSTINLLNPNDPENKANSQLRPNGTIGTNPSWSSTVSHKMSVKGMPRDYYRTNQRFKAKVAEYDVNGHFLEIKEIFENNSITLNEQTDYVRMEFQGSASKWVFARSVSPIAGYIPFGFEYELKRKYIDSYLPKNPINTNPVFARKSTLSNGEKLSTADVPQIKANYQIGFRARITSFDSITISNHADIIYSTSSLAIDSTNLIVKRNESVQETIPHGLNISNYIDVVISARDDFKADITISTNSGTAQKTMLWNGSGGKISVVSTNSELTDCYLSWYSKDLFKPIWAFGDSYFDGWTKYLTSQGYNNWMIDGVSGRAALGAWYSLQKAMKFNTPEKILWCMGMNDKETGSMNQGWYNRYLDVAKYCDQNNIELILTTIPTNRNSSHEIKNKFIREESSRRYVDIAKAVGADISPDWYDGLLSSDGTHPTEKGYAVIATRVATDVPELMS